MAAPLGAGTLFQGIAAVIRLIRLEYCALGATGVLLGALLTGTPMTAIPVLLSAVAVFFVASGCYAFDDLADLCCDRENERFDRPLVSGRLSPRVARVTGAVSFMLAAAATAAAGTIASLLIVVGAITAMVYNRWLQGLYPLKNVLFAAAFPVPLLIGWLAGGGGTTPLFLYCIGLVFTAGLGFETMIDVADASGDQRSGVVTLATRYGTGFSARLAAVLHMAAAALVLLLFVLPLDARLQGNALFLTLAAIAAVANSLIGINLVRNHTSARVFTLKRLAFLTLTTGLVAIVLGLLIAV